MKAYKGFSRNEDGTLSCRGFIYEPGKTYKHEGEIKLCRSGFHACHELWQTWLFYPNNGKNVFYEVECGTDIMGFDNSFDKFVCSEIKLVKEINMTNIAIFDVASYFYEGFARVILDGKCNFINTEGKLLSEQWFDDAGHFHEGFVLVKLTGKWNFINTKGELLSEQWFDEAWNFSEGFAKVKLNNKWNHINTEGRILSEQWFDDAWDFTESFALVEVDKKYNFIDTEGKFLTEQWFDSAWYFSEGFAKVKLDGKWMRINTEGDFVEKLMLHKSKK